MEFSGSIIRRQGIGSFIHSFMVTTLPMSAMVSFEMPGLLILRQKVASRKLPESAGILATSISLVLLSILPLERDMHFVVLASYRITNDATND